MKNPVIIIDLSSLESILDNIDLKRYTGKNRLLAAQIAFLSLGVASPNLKVNVVSNNIPSDVRLVIRWFDNFKKKYSGNPFATQVEDGSSLHKMFIKYTSLLTQKHEEYKQAGGSKSFDNFVGCFMQFSFERGGISQRKFTVANLFGEGALAGGESGMTDLLVIEKNQHPEYLSYLIQEMNKVFGYSFYTTLEGDAKNKAKLIVAINNLISSRKEGADQSEETIKKLISLWVVSSFEGFVKVGNKKIVTRNDFDLAVGFISGTEQGDTNTAVTRFKDKIRTLIEKPIKPYDTQ